jgi:hypothetical protein
VIAALLSLPANGQENEREWTFVLNFPMLWLPDISGEIDVDGKVVDVDVPISETLDSLDMGFIGEAYARWGPWTFAFRTMYLSIKDETTTDEVGLPGLPPLIGRHRVESDSELFTSDLFVAYSFNPYVGMYSGVRRSGTTMELKVRELDDGQGIIELPRKVELVDDELFDWIVGVLLEYPLSRDGAWRVALEADTMFAGDNDENYQINGFFSYAFNERHSVWFGYRHLRMVQEMKVDGSRVETDFAQSGPTLGWAFTF